MYQIAQQLSQQVIVCVSHKMCLARVAILPAFSGSEISQEIRLAFHQKRITTSDRG